MRLDLSSGDERGLVFWTVTLRIFEMENFEHLSPWLSSLYVPTEKRHKGVGAFLVRELVQHAKKINIPNLYLFTEKSADWYKQMGWITFKKVIHRNFPATIMKIEL